MKATKLIAGLAVAGLAASAFAAKLPVPGKISTSADTPQLGGVAASAAGLNYSTGFEQADGYLTTGYIDNVNGLFPNGCGSTAAPCWGHTTSTACSVTSSGQVACLPSLITPTLDTNFPFAGTQHLRLTSDPTTRTNQSDLVNGPAFQLGVDARFPRTAHLSARPIAPNTVSNMVSISSAFGQDFKIQPQSNSYTLLSTSALFFYAGTIYILDDLCGATGLGFQGTGAFWDTTGAYKKYEVVMNPCAATVNGVSPDTVNYSYDGAQIYTGCTIAGQALEQYLVFGDNFQGSEIRIDDLVMQAMDACPSVCGNGIIESPPEQCEPNNQPNGCNPGHGCNPDCTCTRTCTLAEPCILNNGANGPFYGPYDAVYGGIFVYTAPAGVGAVSVELCGSTGADQRIFYWGSCSDPADPGSANDDCYPGYSGADPTASCYGTVTGPNYESCTCHTNPLPGDTCYLLQIRPPAGAGHSNIEINKKAVCNDVNGHLGACCDTNGADTGCTDNVLSSACQGADKVWTENGKCASTHCECIPDCSTNPYPCGDDGCGGSCGTCGDGDACNGNETCDGRNCVAGTPLTCNDGNACNGVETCNPSSGCVPGSPLNCDNGVACDGQETCNPSSGCVAGTPVNCDDGVDCTVDACNEPDGSCTHDDADCSIPTVSEWGLVVLALMLLIGAKVYFGRRQAIA